MALPQLVVTLVILLSFARLFFGVDFADESYYLAVPLRYLLGDRPFIDELNINQSAGLLFLPLMGVYHAIFGTEGIVLFGRLTYWALTVGTAAIVYHCLSSRLGKQGAILSALLVLAQIPINIPNVSYNTLGSRFFTIAVMLSLKGSDTTRPGRYALLSGIASGLAAVCYPTLAVPAAVIFFFLRGHRVRFALGGLAPLIMLAALLLRPGVNLQNVLRYTHAFDYGGSLDKFPAILGYLAWSFNPRALTAWYLLLALAILSRRSPRASSAALLSIPFALALLFSRVGYPGSWMILYFGLAAPWLFLAGPRSETERSLLWRVWLPSITAALVTAWTSSNGASNAAVGIVPAAIASAFFLHNGLRSALGGARPALALSSLALILTLAQFARASIYNDQNVWELTARMPDGPFRGLRTTAEKIAFWSSLATDIRSQERKEGRVVFYEFPAGYLITSMRPGVSTAWLRRASHVKDLYLRYYQERMSPDDRAFFFRRIDATEIFYSPKDPLHRWFHETHRTLVSRKDYDILAPGAPPRRTF